MIEDWQVALMMAKFKQEELLEIAESDRIRREYKKNNSHPVYYHPFQKIGKFLIKLGSSIENRFKTSDYQLNIVRVKA